MVNYNGEDLTVRCLERLRRTAWPPDCLELVLVDNSPGDGVAERARAAVPGLRVLDAGGNRGFAGGCNLGIADLAGVEHVALVNNDAEVEPGWLAPLVDALEADPGVGAANPKVLFADRFVDVHVSSATTVRGLGDRRPLGVRLSGATIDGRDARDRLQLVWGFWGLEHGTAGEGPFEWTAGHAHLRVPARGDGGLPACELRLASEGPRDVVLRSGEQRTGHRVGPAPQWYPVALGGEPFDVVNNVGAVVLPHGHGADRGYLERDEGQFDAVEEIFAWSGAAVLLSGRYLGSVGLLEDRFFLYYEDFDLSWRGRAEGWRYLYVPQAVVRHRHSTSTVEGSPLFSHYDERNRLLTLTRNAPASLAAKEAARHLLVTASYARRDVVSPLIGRRPTSGETVRRRLGAYGAWARLLPEAVAARRRLGERGRITAEELARWMDRR